MCLRLTVNVFIYSMVHCDINLTDMASGGFYLACEDLGGKA